VFRPRCPCGRTLIYALFATAPNLGGMRGHTKPSGHTAHSKRRNPTEILHARMPPDAGEAGHGPKSDPHTDCGNYERHGESRLRASASRTVNRPRTTTGHMRRSRASLAVVLLPSLRSIGFGRHTAKRHSRAIGWRRRRQHTLWYCQDRPKGGGVQNRTGRWQP